MGDYGRVENGNFKREGNIFEELKLLAAELGVNPMDVAFHPVQRNVCDADDTDVESDNVTTKVWSGPALVLCRPVGLSLPNNQHIVLLLKALSTRLTARCLVMRVIRCSTWHATTPFSPQLGRNYSEVWGNCEFLHITSVDSLTSETSFHIGAPEVLDRAIQHDSFMHIC